MKVMKFEGRESDWFSGPGHHRDDRFPVEIRHANSQTNEKNMKKETKRLTEGLLKAYYVNCVNMRKQ